MILPLHPAACYGDIRRLTAVIPLSGGSLGGMSASVVKRTFSMRAEVDQMLVKHVEREPGASFSATVNAALVDYLEAAALKSYRQWDAQAGPDERDALAAFATHNDAEWASE